MTNTGKFYKLFNAMLDNKLVTNDTISIAWIKYVTMYWVKKTEWTESIIIM